jgi:hypothetical protein
MTKRQWEKLHAVIARLEALQNEVSDQYAKERMQAAKSELMYLLRSEPE